MNMQYKGSYASLTNEMSLNVKGDDSKMFGQQET